MTGLAIAALAVAATAALAQQDGPPVSPSLPLAVPVATGLEQLTLGDVSGVWPDHFVLFKDAWLPGPNDLLFGPPSLWRGAQSPAPPRLVGMPTFGLSVQLGEETGADGRRRLVLTPSYRKWDDLNGWEKFAVTLQYAGAAAAVAHFAGKLVH